MEDTIERKFILAYRPKYNSEDIVNFTFHNKSKIRCYLVLKEYELDLLVAELNYFVIGNSNEIRLNSNVYPFLNDDSMINGYVTVISKNMVIKESNEYINKSDFVKTMKHLKGRNFGFFDDNKRENFEKFCCEYYGSKINVGSIVSFRVKSGYEIYYVKEKYDNSFLGVKLHYDPLVGLSVTNEENIIFYNNSFVDIAFEKEYSDKVLSMINKH